MKRYRSILRPRSTYALANQPRRRPPLEHRRGFGRWGQSSDWRTPEIERKIRSEPVCRNCGFVGVDPHHAVPRSLSKAGRSNPLNVIPLCRFCHDAHHGGRPLPRSIFTAEEWKFVQTLIGPGWLARRYPRESQ